ncbi:hypothetical protein [Enterococcus raffinosus]|uniref:Uncharacterized protein n=1 Tax=Enterococcus raffinosus TaxID=71452 RepID=A0AAW8TDB2_9ENTE|nr:hypothetical protein [Enterococcus raffinosus]MDT2525855.1 hypothetical protein [Enterococcus raffinosus]MDT2530134.1 hypothetical protein [Enterococcus raffinosus]MDT2532395.1 hypothetical protein [Enterococcus raffinosus]MDT2546918.1 hypothetical protein [Enterococcus raffinosus]MDT2576487.1 hypothetical protein [Enterococcus raffinosus]
MILLYQNGAEVSFMIDFITKEEFLKAGLKFTDLFEESLFDYYLELDGLMYYDPKTKYMYDIRGVRAFYVEQVFIGVDR